MQVEMNENDHRVIGKSQDLFHIQEEGKGMVFWHPKGWAMWRSLEDYMRRQLDQSGYVEVKSPQVLDKKFWEQSGHWDKYRENMFVCEEIEEDVMALKPMNCPGHIQIFDSQPRSYRDLPMRVAEFGACHRYEPSGSLVGLLRVRAFVQDDAHIFCREDQIVDEIRDFIVLAQRVHAELGLVPSHVNLCSRPVNRAGSDEFWDQAEGQLAEAAKQAGVEVQWAEGDGAFYAPKLDFIVKDVMGREWCCGSLQLDYVLPKRLNASYIGQDGQKHRPVMLHRAILGSFERFLGIMIENFKGAYPMWISPVQVVVAPIVSEVDGFAEQVAAEMKRAGLRVEANLRNEKISAKVRDAVEQKVPVIAVVGKREAEQGLISLRYRGSNESIVLPVKEAIQRLKEEALAPDLK